MNKKIFYTILVLILIFSIGGIIYHKISIAEDEVVSGSNTPVQNQEIIINETTETGEIIEITVDSVEGITKTEAEELCFSVMGEKDEDTGFAFSFGTAGAIEKDKKQYYVIRASWLVNNSHMSYIGDFFVSADGKEIYTGTSISGEYVIDSLVWSE